MPGGRRAQRCPGRGGGRAGCGAELPLCLRAKFGGRAGAEALPRHLPRARRALAARCPAPWALRAPPGPPCWGCCRSCSAPRWPMPPQVSRRAGRVPVPRAVRCLRGKSAPRHPFRGVPDGSASLPAFSCSRPGRGSASAPRHFGGFSTGEVRGTGAKPCPVLPAGGCPGAPGMEGRVSRSEYRGAAPHAGREGTWPCPGEEGVLAQKSVRGRRGASSPEGPSRAGQSRPQPSHTHPHPWVAVGRARECGGGSWPVPGKREGSCGEPSAAILPSRC